MLINSCSPVIEYSKLGSLELNSAEKNLAHLSGLNAIVNLEVLYFVTPAVYVLHMAQKL
jgi:hypothetical protein